MRIQIIEGDITRSVVDAIVNAANTTLFGGGGVDGAIHRVAGPELLAECRSLGGCPTGEARLTRGYRLPANYVIHTVGPVYRDGRSGEPELLESCYRSSLDLAVEHGFSTLAFPAISCGVYGYPLEAAARIAIATIATYLASHESIQVVTFVLFGREGLRIYEETYKGLFGELHESTTT